MIQSNRISTFLRQIHMFPLFLLGLSVKERLIIVVLSYGLGIPGLWLSFPRWHNAISVVVPIICLCWLFRYRGLLISIFTVLTVMCLIYYYLLGANVARDQSLVERAIVGFVVALLLSLTICWLRTAVDLVHIARQQALTAEQKHMLALENERHITIAYEQQRKINELKDQFLLNISHELCTPLTVIGSSLELLKEYGEQLNPLQKEYWLNQALASQESLVDLVNGVLDTTMVVSEIPPVKPEAIHVHQLLEDVLALLAPEDAGAYTIHLEVPEQTMVWADPQLLRQVLQNLFSNIFKYVPRQTEVNITTTQATPSSLVYLSVQDTGPGIPAKELPLLFEKFVRLKRDLAGTTRGMGLGLYISKQLVEAMEGRIWVESSGHLGEGSRFCLTLPPYNR